MFPIPTPISDMINVVNPIIPSASGKLTSRKANVIPTAKASMLFYAYKKRLCLQFVFANESHYLKQSQILLSVC